MASEPREERSAANVQREVATVMKALAPMGGTKEQSDACIALGRLAAWAEAGLDAALRHRNERAEGMSAATVCCICGTADDLRIAPIMTGDRFGEPAKYPVCGECVRDWYESGETTAEGILAFRDRRKTLSRARELRAEADLLEASARG